MAGQRAARRDSGEVGGVRRDACYVMRETSNVKRDPLIRYSLIRYSLTRHLLIC